MQRVDVKNEQSVCVKIRPVRKSDFPEWLRMGRALWPGHSRKDLVQELLEYATRPRRRAVRVAERESGKLCGFINVSLRDVAEGASTSPVGYIEGWYVDPDVRRSGIGRALVCEGERWARSRGCTEMGSDAEISNKHSEHAHRALGYRVTDRLVTFLRRIDRSGRDQ